MKISNNRNGNKWGGMFPDLEKEYAKKEEIHMYIKCWRFSSYLNSVSFKMFGPRPKEEKKKKNWCKFECLGLFRLNI